MSLNDVQKKNILVIGDVMLDVYLSGDVTRISPEAPIPVLRKKSERYVLGGAANVAANLVAAEQNVSIMTIIGNDVPGSELQRLFQKVGVESSLILSLNRCTTEKVRFLASDHQQVLRLDIEDDDPISDNDCVKLLKKLRERINYFDLIIISDYLKGLLSYDLTQGIIKMAREINIPVIVDVKGQHLGKYRGATLLKPNLNELQDLIGKKVETDEEIINASESLRELCHCQYVLTTCGNRGMVFVGDGEPYFIKAIGQEVFDVTGAGDTAIAYLAACMVNGFSMKEAVKTANLAAGVQISKVGTSSVSWGEIRGKASIQRQSIEHKIIKGMAVENFRKDHEGKKIVFTNGCFDLLHIGHIRYLQKAAKLGNILIIGLNSDNSVRQLKGQGRPIIGEQDRMEILAALEFVDYIATFDEGTPLELIKKIQPDVLVKGGDYKEKEVVGVDFVKARGGKLVLIPFVEGRSTTSIIEKIKNQG